MNTDDRSLLLLGMLKAQRSHGYQMHEFIEKNLARVADLKKATAYATLDKLAKEGLVQTTSKQVGNRPPRGRRSLVLTSPSLPTKPSWLSPTPRSRRWDRLQTARRRLTSRLRPPAAPRSA